MSLRDFRLLGYSSRDGHTEGDHVNRGRDTPSFCSTLQVLDMSTLGDAEDVSPVIKCVCGRNLITGLTSSASPRVDISSTCKVGQKLGVSLSPCRHAPLRRDHPDYCTAEVGNPRGTYELPCINAKVELTLCLIKCHVMKAFGRMEVQLLTFLDSRQHECDYPVARPKLFNPRGQSPQVKS